MDAIGGTSSLLTNIHGAVKTYKLIKSLAKGYHNAPAEIKDLGQRLETVHAQILFLSRLEKSLSENSRTINLDAFELDHLSRSLGATRSTFSEILAFLQKKTTKTGSSTRLRWACFDASKVKEWESRLQHHGELLQTTLILLNRFENKLTLSGLLTTY